MTAAEASLNRFHPQTAWRTYYSTGGNRWDEAKVAHLYRRAGFGANWQQIQDGVKLGPNELATRLLNGGGPEAERAFEREIEPLRSGMLQGDDVAEAKALWLYRMLYSPHPLRERMTLFWHNHFATSNAKVGSLRLMQLQNETLRRHALGRFDLLLMDLTTDPAMLVWLDSATNRKGAPNENYAREIMELFSLGVGHYTETDIKEAARALTGWEMRDGKAYFNADQHDDGVKTLFGQSGRFGAADVVRLCLCRDDCAVFLVRKLFRELISETVTPSAELLQPLVDGFRVRNYDIGWLVATMLRSWVFHSPAAIGQKVKSPCDFLLGMVTALEGRVSLTQLADACDELGQSLFHPPSVKGWDGGPAWVNSTTLLRRQNLAFEATRGTGPAARIDPARLTEKYGVSGAENIAEFFLMLFHQQADPETVRSIVEQLHRDRLENAGGFDPAGIEAELSRSAAHLALTLPEYQVG
jgi:uncharacterized protein (DUF1800 family)